MPTAATKILTQSSAPVFGRVWLPETGFTVGLGLVLSFETGAGVVVAVGVLVGKVGLLALYKLHELSFSFTRTAQEADWFVAK